MFPGTRCMMNPKRDGTQTQRLCSGRENHLSCGHIGQTGQFGCQASLLLCVMFGFYGNHILWTRLSEQPAAEDPFVPLIDKLCD